MMIDDILRDLVAPSGLCALDWRRDDEAPEGHRVRVWQFGAPPTFLDIVKERLSGEIPPRDQRLRDLLLHACRIFLATPNIYRVVATVQGRLEIGEDVRIHLHPVGTPPLPQDDIVVFPGLPEGPSRLVVGLPAHLRLTMYAADGIPTLDAEDAASLVLARTTEGTPEAMVWRAGNALLLHANGTMPPLLLPL